MTYRTFSLLATAACLLPAQGPGSLFAQGPAGLAGQGHTGAGRIGTGGFRGMEYAVMDRRFSNAQVKGAPYSAREVTESTQTLADGSHIKRSSTTQVYRDIEGRVRMERSFTKPGASAETKAITIIDPVAGAQFQVDSQAKTAVRTSYRARVAPADAGGKTRTAQARTGQFRGSQPNGATDATQRVTDSLGHQSFDGVDAEGTRTTTTIPPNTVGNEAPIQVVSERWYSAELQTVVMSRHVDPRAGEVVYKLVIISRANPDASLFQVSSDVQVSERAQRGFAGRRPE